MVVVKVVVMYVVFRCTVVSNNVLQDILLFLYTVGQEYNLWNINGYYNDGVLGPIFIKLVTFKCHDFKIH